MNEKEVAELRRQFRSDRSNIKTVYGCCVNENNQIASTFAQSMLDLTDEEQDALLGVLKKTFGGGVGRSLCDIAFPNNAVLTGAHHALLQTLRTTQAEDESARRTLFEKIVPTVHLDSRYVILLASDVYDVFSYSKDGKKDEDSASVFSFIVCAVCPLKQSRAALSFSTAEKPFRSLPANSVIAPPEIAFAFPAFDGRQTNIYNALLYTRNIGAEYSEFVDAVFHTERPMPAGVQKETFRTVLGESVSDSCDLTVVEAVKDQLSDMIEIHRASREREPLTVAKETISDVLRACDVPEERVEAFSARYDEAFGRGVEMPPQNLIDTKHYHLETPDVSVKVNPERADLVTTRVIDGVKYILIRADDTVALNGVDIRIS